MENELITFLRDWIIPVGSTSLTIWFASAARRDSERADGVLRNINSAVEGWQRQIMASTANILDSLPQVVKRRVTLAKVDAAKALTEGIQSAIHEIARNPQPGATGAT
jgi:hypothetical protein